MFSINYLYSIKDNFAILYRGSDKNIVEKIILETKKVQGNHKIAIFVRAELAYDGLFSLEEWNKMQNSFPKYHEVLIDTKNTKLFRI